MSNEYSPGGSRGSRRGGRRRGGRSNRSDHSSERANGSHHTRQAAKPQKKTLLDKIASFFGVKKSGGAKPSAAKTQSASPSERPARPARTQSDAPRQRTARKPESVEVTSPRVYVGNLSFDAVESDLQELFSGIGLVQNVEIVTNKHNQRSKGFGFVQFQTVDEARRAVSELHDKEYMGRKLVVSGAKAADERRAERSAQPEQ